MSWYDVMDVTWHGVTGVAYSPYTNIKIYILNPFKKTNEIKEWETILSRCFLLFQNYFMIIWERGKLIRNRCKLKGILPNDQKWFMLRNFPCVFLCPKSIWWSFKSHPDILEVLANHLYWNSGKSIRQYLNTANWASIVPIRSTICESHVVL